MTEGLDKYHHDPMKWAVGTVLEGNTEHDGYSAEELVENVWEFIVACFENEGLPLPEKHALIRRVSGSLRNG